MRNWNMKVIIAIIFVIVTGTLNAQDVKKVKITDLEKTITESKTPLIVSFWATFCMPCLEEIPDLQDVTKKYKGSADSIQLLLVSLDLQEYYPKKLQDFAVKRKFTAPVLWLDEYNADYFCPKVDSSWSGAIPATLMINNKTGRRKFFEEQLSREKIEKEIMTLVGKTN
jgi:thiol-disulfide isomerase/thioredoxin